MERAALRDVVIAYLSTLRGGEAGYPVNLFERLYDERWKDSDPRAKELLATFFELRDEGRITNQRAHLGWKVIS